MFALWLRPVLLAVAVAAALELLYVTMARRRAPTLLERFRLQLWIAALTVLTLLVTAPAPLLPLGLDATAYKVAGFLAVVLTVELGYRTIDRLGFGRRLDRHGRPAVPQLVRDLGTWVAVLAGIVLGGWLFLDLDFESIVLPSAVISAVLGFALQDVLKNVFAGLALQTEQPFDIGDWLLVDGEARLVVEMSWRSTHMRDNLGVDFREPNANLVAARVTNLGSGARPVGFAARVGVVYEAPPRLVKEALERAVREVPGVAVEPPPAALLARFGDSAIEYDVRYWTREVAGLARLRDGVLSRIWYRLRREGWAIPFPIRTVQLETAERLDDRRQAARRERLELLLARTDLFATLAPEVRARLAAAARLEQYDAGERLVDEGAAGDSLLLVSRGRVVVTKAGAELDTAQLTLAVLGEGSYFGELSLLTGAPRSATVTAEGGVEVFVLDRGALTPILEGDPALAETLSRVLAERAAATAARLEDKREAKQRIEETDHHNLLRRIRGFFRLGAKSEST